MIEPRSQFLLSHLVLVGKLTLAWLGFDVSGEIRSLRLYLWATTMKHSMEAKEVSITLDLCQCLDVVKSRVLFLSNFDIEPLGYCWRTVAIIVRGS